MSKVVKGVGRAIGKVVKGVGKIVKKVVKSPIGKIIAGAALVYFGGAALMGGFGAAAQGGSFLSGLGSGVSSALSGISNAWTALTTGQGVGAAGSALGSGFTGGATNAANWAASNAAFNAAPAAANAAPALTSAAEAAGAASPWTQSSTGLNVLASEVAPGAGSSGSGLINGARQWWNTLDPTEKFLTVQGASTGLQTGLKMYGAAQTAEEQAEAAEAQRQRYNQNIGTLMWPSGAVTYPVSPAPQAGVTRRY